MAEKQLDLIEAKKQRGGAREGAGRKPKRAFGGMGATSKTMRVPNQYADVVKDLIARLDAASKLEVRAGAEVVEKVLAIDRAGVDGAIRLIISIERFA